MAGKSGKTVLVDGVLTPIEDLLDGRETPKQAKERKEAVAKEAEDKKEKEAEKQTEEKVLSQSKRELNESRRMKGLRALIKAKVHYDPNWRLSEVMDACKKAKLLDEKGKVIKSEEGDDEVTKITPKEAAYRSDLQAKLMDADIDFDMDLETEELEEIWEEYVDTLEEEPIDEIKRILTHCDYELEDDMSEKELRTEIEQFRAEMVVVATSLEVEFKGVELTMLYDNILKAKDEKDAEANDEDADDLDDDSEPTTPEVVEPVKEVKEKDLSEKDKILLNARKDDLIAKIKKLGNPDLKPTKAYGLPKLEQMWKDNKPKL